MQRNYPATLNFSVDKCSLSVLKSKEKLLDFTLNFCKQFVLTRNEDLVIHTHSVFGLTAYQLTDEAQLVMACDIETQRFLLVVLDHKGLNERDIKEFINAYFTEESN